MAHEVPYVGTVHRRESFDVIVRLRLKPSIAFDISSTGHAYLFCRESYVVACPLLESAGIRVNPLSKVQRNALLITLAAMCQMFYVTHEKCTCIFIRVHYAPCAAYSHAHPEVLVERPDPFADTKRHSTDLDPFADPQDRSADPVLETEDVGKAARPKLLTREFQGLDLACYGIDFVSIDINETRAPKGLRCSELNTPRLVHRPKGETVACRLCDRPDVLENVESIVKCQEEGSRKEVEKAEGKGKEKENEKGKGFLYKTAKLGKVAIRTLKGVVSGKSKNMKND